MPVNLLGLICGEVLSLCTCTHAYFLTSVGVLQISMRKEIQRLSFQNSCLMLFQMAYDLLNITITFRQVGIVYAVRRR